MDCLRRGAEVDSALWHFGILSCLAPKGEEALCFRPDDPRGPLLSS